MEYRLQAALYSTNLWKIGGLVMDFNNLSLYAAAAFGLEGLVSGELKRLGMKNVRAENGGAAFSGSVSDAFFCNLRLRFSDRVYIVLDEKPCFSFDELFRMVGGIPWERLVQGDEVLYVTAQCARSQLMSPRDCQSITKKAIIERLKSATGQRVFPETGAEFPVHVSIHGDRTRILLDTSGSSLSRRGYRTWNGEAPLRETLAAALVELSPWRPGQPLYDPCCGTGTLLIEAALRQGHMSPGRNRSFAMENFRFFPEKPCRQLRETVLADCQPDRISQIAGSDIDPEAISLAKKHLLQSGTESGISLRVMPLQSVRLDQKEGVFLCNPPYGQRIGDQSSVRSLAKDLAELQKRHPSWSLCAISSDPGFEKAYGRRADKTRRLYNGRLECQFFTFLPLR